MSKKPEHIQTQDVFGLNVIKAVNKGLKALIKPVPLTPVEWANANFKLSPESSYTVGRWVTAPFQVAILNSMGNDDIQKVDLIKSARVGYTKMLLAVMGYFLEHKKRNQIVYQPTDSAATDFMKSHVETMIRDVEAVRELAPWLGKKHRDNTKTNKLFLNRKQLYVFGGKSAKNYREKSVDCVFYDELSSFDNNVDKEGSPISLGDKRTEGSIFAKSIRGSTPKIKDTCLITQEAENANHLFYRVVPCPRCGKLQRLVFGGKEVPYGLKWEERNPDTVHYVCRFCHGRIENNEIFEMDEHGRYESDKGVYTYDGLTFYSAETQKQITTPEHVAFHIWTIYSPFSPWRKIVVDFLDARKSPDKLKTFVNTTLGEAWEEDEESPVEHFALYQRREHYQADIPDGVCFLTAAVDVQDDRFEFEILGWGKAQENWSIEYIQLYGNLTRSEIWQALGEMLTRSYSDRFGRQYSPQLITIDSGGHFTNEVYDFSIRMGRKFVIPVKGASVTGKPIENFPNKPNKKRVYLTEVGTENAKQNIYTMLSQNEVGAGYCHFPVKEAYNEAYFRMLTAEKQVVRIERGQRVKRWVAKGRNEALDCRVYNLAAYLILTRKFGVNPERLAAELWDIDSPINDKMSLGNNAPLKKKRRKATRRGELF